MSAVPLSYLFVPADRPARFATALASGAQAVIIDLEDAVAPAAKPAARQALAQWLADAPDSPNAPAVPLLVRVNAASTPWIDDDLALCRHPRVCGVVVPKAEDAQALSAQSIDLPDTALLPLIETAAGVDAAREIARARGVTRLLFGSIDFQADLGIEGDDDALLHFRSHLVLVSRLAGLDAPVDGVTTALDDEAVLAHDTARARRLGFGAKLCIHPRQIATVHRGFRPTEVELAWANRVLDAAQAGGGAAVAVDGKMVDAPVLLRAQRLLARATS